MKAPLPTNEAQRLAKLLSYDVLDTEAESGYDDLTALAAQICGTPISLVSLVDGDRQWFKSKVGVDATETHRDHAFCAHAILQKEVMVIPNAPDDPRFADNPLVTAHPEIRFYAGAPLITQEGYGVGTLCVIDSQPRNLSPEQTQALKALSRQVVNQLELRLKVKELQAEVEERKQIERELRRTQAQMIQQEKLSIVGQLVAGVAHEINNPMTFIEGNLRHLQGYTQDLLQLVAQYEQDFPQGSEAIAQLLNAIDLDYLRADYPQLFQSMQYGTQRVRQIVSALRTFSHLDEQGIKPLDLGENLDSILMILASSLEEQRIQLRRDYQDLPTIEGDAGALNQVFLQILENSMDALAQKEGDRRIHIQAQTMGVGEASPLENRLQLQIHDNGIGITPQIQTKVFDPFFTTKPVGKGTGLGLFTAHAIITQQHHGEITCESEPGQGTTITITLPLQSVPMHRRSSAPPLAPPAPNPKGSAVALDCIPRADFDPPV